MVAGAASGAIVLDEGLAALDCRLQQLLPAGDHVLALLEVVGRAGARPVGPAADPAARPVRRREGTAPDGRDAGAPGCHIPGSGGAVTMWTSYSSAGDGCGCRRGRPRARPGGRAEGRRRDGSVDRRTVRADLEEVFRRDYGRVVAVAARVLGSRSEAEDVAQEVFLAFGRSSVPAGEAPRLAVGRGGPHRAEPPPLRAAPRRPGGDRRRPRDRPPDVAEQVVSREESGRVRAALARLPPKQAAALVLRHSGLSYADVAAALDMSLGSVGTTVRRAESALRKELTPSCVIRLRACCAGSSTSRSASPTPTASTSPAAPSASPRWPPSAPTPPPSAPRSARRRRRPRRRRRRRAGAGCAPRAPGPEHRRPAARPAPSRRCAAPPGGRRARRRRRRHRRRRRGRQRLAADLRHRGDRAGRSQQRPGPQRRARPDRLRDARGDRRRRAGAGRRRGAPPRSSPAWTRPQVTRCPTG